MASRVAKTTSGRRGHLRSDGPTSSMPVPLETERLSGVGMVGTRDVGSLLGMSDTATRASVMLSLQRRTGNQSVQRAVAAMQSNSPSPEPISLDRLPERLAGLSDTPQTPGVVTTIAFAGTEPDVASAPGGLAKIRAFGNPAAAGVTRTSMSYGSKPLFRQGAPEKVGNKWKPNVLRARPEPPTFESYYPAGDALHLVGKSRKGKKYVFVSPDMSELVKRGEQEHIDDGLEAYRVTREAIRIAIEQVRNDASLLSTTEDGARRRAEEALARKLPRQLLPEDWTRDAQMKKWEGEGSVPQQMIEVSDKRDGLLSPHALTQDGVARSDWKTKLPTGTRLSKGDQVEELKRGTNTRIPGTGSPQLIEEAFNTLPGGRNAPTRP